jgi:predicted anti-sigma-YlaC factor YlaD
MLLLCCGACRRICKKKPTTNGDYITVQTNSPAVLPTETPITRQEKRKRFLIKRKRCRLTMGGRVAVKAEVYSGVFIFLFLARTMKLFLFLKI